MLEADSIDQLRRDHTSLVSFVDNLTTELRIIKDFVIEMHTDRAVRLERDKNMNERLTRIEKSIETLEHECRKDFDSIKNLGKWVLLAFGAVLITAIGNFIINGGFGVVQ